MGTPKEIIFEEEARTLLGSGIQQLAKVAAVTLGPNGLNVGLESFGAPKITSDGYSIVKDISLKNDFENMGASIVKEAAQKMKDKCGDGTTTLTILLTTLVENGIKLVASGASPIGIKRGMEKALEAASTEIKKRSIPIRNSADLRNIATVSASGDREIGKLIADAMEMVENTGVITIEEAKSTETTIEKVEGMQFDRGYLSPYFCTNSEKMIVEMQHPEILIIDHKVSNIHEMLPILQTIAASGKDLLIIAEDIESEALATLVINKVRKTLKVAAVKAPGFGDRRKAMLQDIATLTGATVVSEETGITLKTINTDVLGKAEKVVISKDNTLIINGAGNHQHIKARVKQIETEIETTKSSYDKEKLLERKAKLTGGVAVIKVGAMTEPELKRRKQVFEDSLNSTKAAQEEGIVPGGGVAFLYARHAIDQLIKSDQLTSDEIIGAKSFKAACEAPLKQIAENTGLGAAVTLLKVLESPENFGLNATTGKVENLIEAGVIDPVKVVINALIYATSAAGIVILTEALISDAKDDELDAANAS